MLTRELLIANAALAALTPEQISTIVALSENDENAVIAQRTGEIYGTLDSDILTVSGIAKNGTEKTYDYAKRVIGEIKTKADGTASLQEQIAQLTTEKARLEKTIADGASDKETAKALKQAKVDLANVTAQYAALNKKYEDALTQHASELFNIRVESELKSAATGLKFKSGLPENVTRIILDQALGKIRAMNPEDIDDGNGGKILAFKGKDGAILRNPGNQLNPYTATELLHKELDGMGVLESGRKQSGSGTKPPKSGSGKSGHFVDVTSAKTRVEAYDAIRDNLLAQGLTEGSADFSEAMTQAWKENNVAALPEQ